MEKGCKKTAINPYHNWLRCYFLRKRPRWFNVHAVLRDFFQKFTRGFENFFNPLVIAPLKLSRGEG